MKNYRLILLLVLFAGWLLPTYGQDSTAIPLSFFDQLFQGDDVPVRMTLTTDMKQLVSRKYKEEDQPATLTFFAADGQPVTYEIKVRARGNRRKEVCFYPPLRLKFRKQDLEQNGLAREHNKLKLVLQCKAFSPSDQYVWKEYLAYRLYNILSPQSFQVQPLELTLHDSRGKAKDRPMAAFLIEPAEELAERLAAVPIERQRCIHTTLERLPFLKMATFQYMIGNTDWYVYNVHNLQLLKVPEYDRILPVPYDFDYAGLVNTDYAVPFHTLPINSVRDRLYTGEACTEEEAESIRRHFLDHQEEILAFCETFAPLQKNQHRDVMNYLESFFETLQNTRSIYAILCK